jgi:hypothetical protein
LGLWGLHASAASEERRLRLTAGAGRNYFKQSEFPLVSLQQAQKIAAAIVDNFAGAPGWDQPSLLERLFLVVASFAVLFEAT